MAQGFMHSFKAADRAELPLVVYNSGFQKCAPGYAWGPGVRDHYMIHYVVSGRWTLELEGRTFVLGPGDALLILCARVFLGAVFSGQMMTLLYSMGGGLLAWLVMVGLRKLLTRKQIWLCSPVAAVFHNLGQLLVAAGAMKTWAVMAYLPYLLLFGIITGLFTGLCAQFLIGRLDKIQR